MRLSGADDRAPRRRGGAHRMRILRAAAHARGLRSRILADDLHRPERRLHRRQPWCARRVDLAGSADLLSQLTQGARGDVFATADTATMDRADRAGLLAGHPSPSLQHPHHRRCSRKSSGGSKVSGSAAGQPGDVRGPGSLGAAVARMEQNTGVRLNRSARSRR